MIGKKKPKKADTAGGSTPEMMLKEAGEDRDQFSRNGTKVAIFWEYDKGENPVKEKVRYVQRTSWQERKGVIGGRCSGRL